MFPAARALRAPVVVQAGTPLRAVRTIAQSTDLFTGTANVRRARPAQRSESLSRTMAMQQTFEQGLRRAWAALAEASLESALNHGSRAPPELVPEAVSAGGQLLALVDAAGVRTTVALLVEDSTGLRFSRDLVPDAALVLRLASALRRNGAAAMSSHSAGPRSASHVTLGAGLAASQSSAAGASSSSSAGPLGQIPPTTGTEAAADLSATALSVSASRGAAQMERTRQQALGTMALRICVEMSLVDSDLVSLGASRDEIEVLRGAVLEFASENARLLCSRRVIDVAQFVGPDALAAAVLSSGPVSSLLPFLQQVRGISPEILIGLVERAGDGVLEVQGLSDSTGAVPIIDRVAPPRPPPPPLSRRVQH